MTSKKKKRNQRNADVETDGWMDGWKSWIGGCPRPVFTAASLLSENGRLCLRGNPPPASNLKRQNPKSKLSSVSSPGPVSSPSRCLFYLHPPFRCSFYYHRPSPLSFPALHPPENKYGSTKSPNPSQKRHPACPYPKGYPPSQPRPWP